MRLNPAIQRGQGRARQLTAERLVNMYPEKAAEHSVSPLSVLGCPGATLLKDLGGGFIRGMHKMQSDDTLWVVHGLTLYQIKEDGTASSKGTIASSGRVAMASTGTELAISAGGKGYIWNGSSLSEITDKDFPRADTVDQMDGYFIWNNTTSGQKGQFFISSLLDGSNYDALDFATAERYPDNLRRVFVNFSDLLLFGTDSLELWFNSGNADFPFEPRAGGQIDKGLGATWSVASLDNSVVWLDSRGIVRMLNGFTPVRISTHAIEYAISRGDWRTTDSQEGAYAYSYIDEGHEFYVLTVPGAGTFVYDAATRLWHERKSKGLDISRMGFHAFVFGKHIVGDVLNGKVYESSLDVYKEDGEEIIAEIILPQIREEGNRFIVHKMELDMESGVGRLNPITTTTFDITGWQTEESAADNNWHGITWSEDKALFVAVASSGTNRVMTSPDGKAWTIRSDAEDNGWQDVAWSPDAGLFAAVASSGTNRVMTSPDGETWTTRSAPAKEWQAIVWADNLGLFVAVANDGSDGQIMTSPDGITWTSQNGSLDSYQLSSSTLEGSVDISANSNNCTGHFIGNDGTSLYLMVQVAEPSSDEDYIYQYTLSTAWDITTATYANKRFSVGAQDTTMNSPFFKSDGLKMYTTGTQTDKVFEWDLGTAWDIETATLNDVFDFSAFGNAWGVYIDSTGERMYVLASDANKVHQFDLLTPWDVTSASDTGNVLDLTIAGIGGNARDLEFSNDGTKVFTVWRESATDHKIRQWNLSTAWDVSTGSYEAAFNVQPQATGTLGFFIDPDGKFLYVDDAGTDAIYQYNMFTEIGGNDLAWSSEQNALVAVGDHGVIVSYDAENWTAGTEATNKNWQGVEWSPWLSKWVAVADTGTGNRAMYSLDGNTWFSATTPVDNDWNAVAWSPKSQTFVAVSDTGTGDRIMETSDGITWSSVVSPADNDWNSVTWSPANDIFAAVGSTGTGDRVMISQGLESNTTVQDDSGVDPHVMLDVSSDTRTYDATQAWRAMGKKGEYSKRVIWRRLGQHRSFTPKFSISDPVKRAVFAVYVDVETCRG